MGYTVNVNTEQYRIAIDGKRKKGTISLEELQTKLKELSPRNKVNIVLDSFTEKGKLYYGAQTIFPYLSDLINVLTQYKKKFGNLPVVFHNETSNNGYRPNLFKDIELVSRYSYPSVVGRSQYINIENENALVFII